VSSRRSFRHSARSATRSAWKRSTRAISSTTEGRGCSPPPTQIPRSCSVITSTHTDSCAWPRRGRSRPSPTWPP
jgi:hypothetical protein